ncbi:MAG: hypothetical protein LIP16_05685 [Clostridium sp.]|nr:hypothetical protein [Clostridium sp.]
MSQERQSTLDEFAAVMTELTEVVCELAQQEEEKASAASERRHEALDGCIRQEQALLMKLKGLEQRRTELIGQLGWDSLTFRQILSQAPEAEKVLMEPLFFSLDWEIGRLRRAHEAANRIIGSRIHELQIFLARAEAAAAADNSETGGVSPFRPFRMQDKYV